MSLQIVLAAETHLADRLTSKLQLTINAAQSLIILEGTRFLTNQIWKEQLILFLNTSVRCTTSSCLRPG
jgi:hypothetical protein